MRNALLSELLKSTNQKSLFIRKLHYQMFV